MPRAQETEELELFIVKETEAAILVSEGDGGNQAWLPLSQVEVLTYNRTTGMASIEVPVWLAMQKELI